MSAENHLLRVSVIIPALNEAEHITRAVETAWAAGADEVIVADGKSDDATRELAQEAGAVVLQCPRGRANQQNAGAAAATGDVLVFQHADNWCGPASIEQIREMLRDAAILGGAFRQCIEAKGFCFRLLERGNALRVRLWGLPYGDQGIFLRRDVFQQLGGFPDEPLMEDLLLMRKFRRLARPTLLPGPHHVCPRRWLRHGVWGQTWRNWWILAAYACGATPAELARHYRRHDDSAAEKNSSGES